MYCGKCGAEIEESASFCPYCGSTVEKETENNDGKVGKMIAIGVAIAAALIVAVVVFKIYSYYKSLPTEQQLQYEVNNYQNGGIVTTDGTWLYYNDNGLCRVRLKDGTQQEVISNDIIPEKMFYAGDSIFYYKFPGIFKEKNGVETDLGFNIFAEDCFQTDGKNYFVTGFGDSDAEGVYSVKASNTSKSKKISDIHPTKLLMYKDYLYVLSNFDYINGEENDNYGTWRINKNGKNKIELMGFCPEYMVFSDDTIYFTDEEGILCSMNLDGSNQEKYDGTYVDGGLNVTDNYVFYLSYNYDNDERVIHRMDKDGGNDIELNQDDSSNICIAGDWIYYINISRDYDIYKMSFDGEYDESIY